VQIVCYINTNIDKYTFLTYFPLRPSTSYIPSSVFTTSLHFNICYCSC